MYNYKKKVTDFQKRKWENTSDEVVPGFCMSKVGKLAWNVKRLEGRTPGIRSPRRLQFNPLKEKSLNTAMRLCWRPAQTLITGGAGFKQQEPAWFRYWTPPLLRPRLPAGAAVTGCVSECPAPASAVLSSSAASGSRPAAARPSAGSAGSSCGPCLGSSSQRRCSSHVSCGTLRCLCWCSSWAPGPWGSAEGRQRSPGGVQTHLYWE